MNSREVNESLMLGSLSDEMEKLIALLELADPALPCLSPLAKAAWEVHSKKSISREVAESALEATFLIASPLGEDLLAGEHICTFECEKVEHTIAVVVASKSERQVVTLSFASEGAVQCLLGGDAPLTPSLALSALSLDRLGPDSVSESQIFDAYKSSATPASPAAYPCDTDYIGILTYRLIRVGAERVNGPCFTDNYNDFSCDDPGLCSDWIEGRQFGWFHQLTREQAEALGLARRDGCHSDPSMPEWLSDDLTISKLWITGDDLKESYTEGSVTDYVVEDILLCLGAGPEWQPSEWESGVDEVDRSLERLDRYPDAQMPIKIVHFNKSSPCNDPDAGAILKLLNNLVRACADQEA